MLVQKLEQININKYCDDYEMSQIKLQKIT